MKNVPAYLFIESEIRKKIRAGEIKPGDRLPVEAKLSAQYGVSRATLRRALRALQADGHIFRIPSKGTFITDPKDRAQNMLKRRQIEIRRSKRAIAALVPSITLTHYPHIIRGVEDECRGSGYQLMIGNFDGDLMTESAYLTDFAETGVRGIIVAPHYRSHENPQYKMLLERGIPLVLTDATIEGIEADLVATDNERGGYEGTQRLIAAGCKRIAFVSGWMSVSTSKERFAGFAAAMREAGLPVEDALVLEGHFGPIFGGQAWTNTLAGKDVDGVFCANDPITTGLLRAIAQSGNTASADLRIASFDRPEIPYPFRHPLTLVEQPAHELGVVACSLLIKRIKAQDTPPSEPTPEPTSDEPPGKICQKILLAPRVRQVLPAPQPAQDGAQT
ncbi:MAG: GntR family transcriptional regulator [Kiritimatiellae bacterium]|nr:GntR family transcriptional regulator [Kiritimatiellia bacterium]